MVLSGIPQMNRYERHPQAETVETTRIDAGDHNFSPRLTYKTLNQAVSILLSTSKTLKDT